MYSSSLPLCENCVRNRSRGEREGLSSTHVQREYSAEPSSLCVEFGVAKEFPISPRFSPAFFHRDAISLISRAYLCTAADSMRRKPCGENVQESVKLCTAGMLRITYRTM